MGQVFQCLEGRASLSTYAIFGYFLFRLGCLSQTPRGGACRGSRVLVRDQSRIPHCGQGNPGPFQRCSVPSCPVLQRQSRRLRRQQLDSWEKQISKSPIISDTLKDLFLFTMAHNLSLSLHYVPSHLIRQINPREFCLTSIARSVKICGNG